MSPLPLQQPMDERTLTIQVPRGLPVGITESLQEGITTAVEMLLTSDSLSPLCGSAEAIASLIITQVRPSAELLEHRIARLRTIKTLLEEGDWLTAEELNLLQKQPPRDESQPAHSWKKSGRIFSVSHDGAEYYARYQFNALYQPLPVIKEILQAYGEDAGAWSIAAWFHFPNGWLAAPGHDNALPAAPKDVLGRRVDVVRAARRQKGTYVA